jgi:hypothetical protein
MKQAAVFILLIFTLASCSSFSRVRYGHVKMVPAGAVVVPVSVSVSVKETTDQIMCFADSAAVIPHLVDTVIASAICNTDSRSVEPSIHTFSYTRSRTEQQEALHATLKLPLRLQTDLPPDLQLFFGILFLLAGIFVLLMCIFFIPYLAGGWLWIVLAELVMLYSAWKLIITAITFLRGRFGHAKTYEEN